MLWKWDYCFLPSAEINKISKISRGWEVSCILRSVKRTKCFCFRNNCVRKRQKMKITVFVWQMSSLTNYSQENRGNCLLFLGSVTPTGLEVSFHLFDWFSPKMKQTISKQKNWALPWQCKNIWILQFFGNAQLIFLAFSWFELKSDWNSNFQIRKRKK